MWGHGGVGGLMEQETANENAPEKEAFGQCVEFGADKGKRERQITQQSCSTLFALGSSNLKFAPVDKS